MKRRLKAAKPTLLGLVFLALVLLLPSVGFATDSMEGTDWKLRPKSFAAKIVFWRFDHLSFRGGMFESRDWKAKGFSPAAFFSPKPGETVTWTATLTSSQAGKVVWEGRREGDRMEGTWTWRKPDGKSKTMPWSAKQIRSH